MATKKTITSPVQHEMRDGFLGVTDDEVRGRAMSLSVAQISTMLKLALGDTATASQRASALLDVASDSLPNNTDNDKSEAALWATKEAVRILDDALCEFGGIFEALIVRLQKAEASHV